MDVRTPDLHEDRAHPEDIFVYLGIPWFSETQRIKVYKVNYLFVGKTALEITNEKRNRLLLRIPYDRILRIAGGIFDEKESKDGLRDYLADFDGIIAENADLDAVLERGHVPGMRSCDPIPKGLLNQLRIIYRDSAGHVRIQLSFDSPGRKYPSDYDAIASIVRSKLPEMTSPQGAHFAKSGSGTKGILPCEQLPPDVPSLEDVNEWADAYGYELVSKD